MRKERLLLMDGMLLLHSNKLIFLSISTPTSSHRDRLPPCTLIRDIHHLILTIITQVVPLAHTSWACHRHQVLTCSLPLQGSRRRASSSYLPPHPITSCLIFRNKQIVAEAIPH